MARRELRGLRRRRPGGVWQIEKRIRGYGPLRESTGTTDRAEAEAYLLERLAQIRRAQLYGERPRRSFRQAAQYYLEHSQKSSLGSDVPHLTSVMPYIGHLELSRVHQGTLQPWIDARLADGKAAATVNRGLAVVRRILNLAARLWRDEHGLTWLAEAPLIQMVQGPQVRPGHVLSAEEQKRLLAELPRHLADMALFGLHTGCREREITGLRWAWLRERDGLAWFALPAASTKAQRSRPVLLARTARAVVEAQRGLHASHVFSFQPRGKRAVRHPVDRLHNSAWRRARARAGLPAVQVHDLRRTVATRLRDLGVEDWDIADVLGHAPKRSDVTRTYALPTLRRLAEVLELLEDTGERPQLKLAGDGR